MTDMYMYMSNVCLWRIIKPNAEWLSQETIIGGGLRFIFKVYAYEFNGVEEKFQMQTLEIFPNTVLLRKI